MEKDTALASLMSLSSLSSQVQLQVTMPTSTHWTVDRLDLTDFRNCTELHVAFGPGINWISGQNGQGKTSLLEALYVCMTGNSFRTPLLRDLIRYDQPAFCVQMQCTRHEVQQKISLRYSIKEKQLLYNQTLHTSRASLCGLFPSVVMTSDDVQIIRGAPQERRDLLDRYLAQIDPLYLHHQSRYARGLKQRNILLKQKAFLLLTPWEIQLAQAGSYIALRRFQAVTQLSQFAKERYDRLTPFAKAFTLRYQTEAPVESKNLETLQAYYCESYLEQRQKEGLLGITLVGPHRDDLLLLLEDHPAKTFASEGEQRSCMSALRMAELDGLKEETGMEPILLIDDIALSLDTVRTISLLQQLQKQSQVFVTTAGVHHETLLHSLCHLHSPLQLFSMQDGSLCTIQKQL